GGAGRQGGQAVRRGRGPQGGGRPPARAGVRGRVRVFAAGRADEEIGRRRGCDGAARRFRRRQSFIDRAAIPSHNTHEASDALQARVGGRQGGRDGGSSTACCRARVGANDERRGPSSPP